MSDIVFMDTETLGLDPDAPVWEFAAIRRFADGHEDSVEFHIEHDPEPWLEGFPVEFRRDYDNRFKAADACLEWVAAAMVHTVTKGAHIVGAVPNFDTERLAKLLRRNGIEPEWHYHLIDVENVVVGYLHGVAACSIDEARMRDEEPPAYLTNRKLGLPWKSDDLSRAVNVNPDDFARHTAMGDVLWVKAQWDAVTAA